MTKCHVQTVKQVCKVLPWFSVVKEILQRKTDLTVTKHELTDKYMSLVISPLVTLTGIRASPKLQLMWSVPGRQYSVFISSEISRMLFKCLLRLWNFHDGTFPRVVMKYFCVCIMTSHTVKHKSSTLNQTIFGLITAQWMCYAVYHWLDPLFSKSVKVN